MSAQERQAEAIRAADGSAIEGVAEAEEASATAGGGSGAVEALSSAGAGPRELAPATVDDRARATLAALADVLIPAGDGMPSASQAGVAGPWLDEVLRSRPDIADDLRRVLEAATGADPSEAVARLQAERPDDFAVLAVVVPGAYYMNPDIRRLIGYPGQQAVPIDEDAPPDHEEDGLLRAVVERGPIYRS